MHLASSFYDLPGFRAGASTLQPFEVSEVGSVAGRRLVHLQCHIGLDTLSWARRAPAAWVGRRRYATGVTAAPDFNAAGRLLRA